MKSRFVLGAGAAVSAVTWLAAGELPGPARVGVALLVGAFPALSLVQASAIEHIGELPGRFQLYFSTIAGLWAITIGTAFVASESGIAPRLMGVTEMPLGSFALWTAITLVAAMALVLGFKAFGMKETPMLQHLIPETAAEKLVYVVVSLTAGLCEEFVFRGFVIAALRVSTGSVVAAMLISAAAFGVAHAHQNAAGALRATLLALVLTVPLLLTGSLYPGIAAHALVDLVGGLWLSRWLLRS